MDLDEVSKSERKRDATRLQNLGRALTRLNSNQLAEIPLTDEMAIAIADYHRFTANEAKRRQLQLIGKLMRKIDTEPVQAALALIEGHSASARSQFRQIEAWRERLINDPDALTSYLAEHPETDRQALRHHIQRVQRARGDDQQRAAARVLFRFLRDSEPIPDQPD